MRSGPGMRGVESASGQEERQRQQRALRMRPWSRARREVSGAGITPLYP